MTFSLAARCATTGMLGAVVTTSSPAVGSRCIFTRARIGVVLTQFWTDPRLGPRGLALLAEGCGAEVVAQALAASTPDRDWRQVAVLDAQGRSAHFSGARTKPALAAATGTNSVAIGNILRNDAVPAAMVDAFEASGGLPFPARLLAALEAGQGAGGEERALVSAALLVSRDEPFPYVDLRVDAAADPLRELRALWDLYAPLAEQYVGRALSPNDLDPQPVR
ncbi:MAG TPA: DUF1028 domain-containing protein [Stellaceae bacterium]|nr:DUF1028 domain-containing protein [Stellaceae bacterium]